jgi:hypothetical protein
LCVRSWRKSIEISFFFVISHPVEQKESRVESSVLRRIYIGQLIS